MSQWRSIVIIALFALPILFFGALGAYALMERGWLFWSWWLLPLCWGLAYFLARRRLWHASLREPPAPDLPQYWTQRDSEAWRIVERAATAASGIAPQSLLDPAFYLRSAEALLLEITRFYHPKAVDPAAPLTVPELLTAAQLAIEDLAELVEVYVPGSRHLTVARWKAMSKIPRWHGIASNLSYLVSAAFGPATAASRYILSKLVLGPALRVMQDNLLYWFYAAFLQRVGLYAIELNSGRLSVGAARWRELAQAKKETPVASGTDTKPAPSTTLGPLTISVVGQLKAGKSSVINALLGRSEAAYDDLPATQIVSRYELVSDDWIGSLVVQDTAGYGGVEDPGALEMAVEVAASSDIVLLAADVLNASREPDRRFLAALNAWFDGRPEFRKPPIMVALTHVDLLSPSMEWTPPYEAWRGSEPRSPKDQTIKTAVERLRADAFFDVKEIIPVCVGPTQDRIFGVEEWLLPAILSRLDEARGVLLLRAIHRESRQDTFKRLWRQTRDVGTLLVRKALGA